MSRERKFSELLEDWSSACFQTLQAALPELETERAKELANTLAVEVARTREGGNIYVPTGFSEKLIDRDIEIAKLYSKGIHVAELNRRFRLTKSATYRAIQRGQAQLGTAEQADMFAGAVECQP